MNKKITFLIRDIPKELWDKAKHRVINDDIESLRQLVLAAIEEYLKKKKAKT